MCLRVTACDQVLHSFLSVLLRKLVLLMHVFQMVSLLMAVHAYAYAYADADVAYAHADADDEYSDGDDDDNDDDDDDDDYGDESIKAMNP